MNGVVIGETYRRFLLNPIWVILVLFLAVIALIVANFEQPGAAWSSMLFVLMLAAGGSLIGPEFSSGTLQLILTKPVNRSTYLLSRWAGVVLFLCSTIGFLASVEAIGRLALRSGAGLEGFGALVLNQSAVVLLACALLALFGTFVRGWFNVALYLLLGFILSFAPPALNAMAAIEKGAFRWIGAFVRRHPDLIPAFLWLDRNLFPDAPRALDAHWLLVVLSNTVIALVLGCLLFRLREVPYGAD